MRLAREALEGCLPDWLEVMFKRGADPFGYGKKDSWVFTGGISRRWRGLEFRNLHRPAPAGPAPVTTPGNQGWGSSSIAPCKNVGKNPTEVHFSVAFSLVFSPLAARIRDGTRPLRGRNRGASLSFRFGAEFPQAAPLCSQLQIGQPTFLSSLEMRGN